MDETVSFRELSPGTHISHYKIKEKIGSGGMGVVYRAEDVKLNRLAALKFLPPELARDPEARVRFVHEAEAALALDHPNICTVYEIDETDDGCLYIAMECYEGETVKQRIQQGPLEVQAALGIALQAAGGLAEAHERGVVHRDIKPANIMITSAGGVKLLDFGLAKLAGQTTLTRTGKIVGTVSYMSPEQAIGGKADHRTDIWSLGVTLYQMVTGELPFGGEYPQAVIYSILNEEPRRVTSMRADLPKELDWIVSKALAKPTDERYQRMTDFVVDLEVLTGAAGPGATISPPKISAEFSLSNLPVQLTSFVGRGKSLGDVKRLLGDNRLLTLTGSGGCGKTRLALEVGRDILGNFADGIWLVDLAPLVDPALVPQAVAQIFELREEANKTLIETLISYLRGKDLLLILDNCEHVLAGCVDLADALLRADASIRMLATSREALGITGEVVYQVAPLEIPDVEALPSLAELQEIEAVQLFAVRAGAARSAFTLDENTAPAVAQICKRLDGIPLAIELAAARARALPVDEIAARLDDRFRILKTGSKTSLPRHQTLRALIDWGYDHLTPAEQALFRRLSVFSGGWTLSAAEAACSGDGILEAEVLDLLSNLVEKSLVEMDAKWHDGARKTRHRLLESLREYAGDRLAGEGETEQVRRRHTGYFVGLAEEAASHLTAPDQADWFLRLSLEHDNLRAALDACTGEGGDVQLAMRLGGALGRYWLVRGHWSEGRRVYEHLLARPDAQEATPARSKVLSWAGNLALNQGEHAQARSFYEESLAERRDLGDRAGVAGLLNNLGLLAHRLGDFEEARRFHEESLVVRRELNERIGIAQSLGNLGSVAGDAGDFREARRFHGECLVIWREIGDSQGIAWSLSNMGLAAYWAGDYAEARSLQEESLAIDRELGNRRGIAATLNGLGSIAVKAGDIARARGLNEESLLIHRDLGSRPGIMQLLKSFGILAAAAGEPTRAARLFGAAEALRDEIKTPWSKDEQAEIDSVVPGIRSRLGENTLTKEWAAGRIMSQSQAIDYALEHGSGKRTEKIS